MASGIKNTARGRVKRAITENTFERTVCAWLTKQGILNFHQDHKFKGGVPDRYVAGGNWIEFKRVLFVGGARGSHFNVDLTKQFSGRQRTFMDRWDLQGDRTWACVLVLSREYPRMILEPWRYYLARYKYINIAKVLDLGVEYGKKKEMHAYLAERFGKNYERMSNGDYYADKIREADQTFANPTNASGRRAKRMVRDDRATGSPLQLPKVGRFSGVLDLDWSDETE